MEGTYQSNVTDEKKRTGPPTTLEKIKVVICEAVTRGDIGARKEGVAEKNKIITTFKTGKGGSSCLDRGVSSDEGGGGIYRTKGIPGS